MRLDRLEAAIAKDRRQGHQPFLVVGTAGSVNTGAMDDLDAIADVAEAHKLWFHVDGAFGALAALSKRLRPLVAGIERAQSIAFDLHKWAHVPYDAGFLLVRDAEAHRRTFANQAAYLQRAPRGLGAGEVWPCDLGPDLSRGFRALKVWFTLETLGADRIAASIERCCRVAQHLEQRLRKLPMFEVVAPVALNIVCFRVRGASRRRAASRRHGPAGARARRPVADRAWRADGDPRGHRQPPHHHPARRPPRRASDGQHAGPTAGRLSSRAPMIASRNSIPVNSFSNAIDNADAQSRVDNCDCGFRVAPGVDTRDAPSSCGAGAIGCLARRLVRKRPLMPLRHQQRTQLRRYCRSGRPPVRAAGCADRYGRHS